MTNIYILLLEEERYYIGRSNNVLFRYQEHINGNGSAWTRKYKPISLEKTITNVSPFEEDKITKEYMSKYGIDKVRGGSYVEIELSKFHIDALKMEIWSAKDLCTNCGRFGHFIKDCYAKTDVFENIIKYEAEYNWGCKYCDKKFTKEFSAIVHEKSCRSKIIKPNNLKSNGICYRCGRLGHYLLNCYASKHINGYYLKKTF